MATCLEHIFTLWDSFGCGSNLDSEALSLRDRQLGQLNFCQTMENIDFRNKITALLIDAIRNITKMTYSSIRERLFTAKDVHYLCLIVPIEHRVNKS